MRIQHNVMAMNSYRNYNNNVNALSSNLEKLSSGYRINRAGDDAAGLAISEKMRAQITGLDAAQKNVKDGISLVKTAEGALQEVQDMMNRMVYLATQSANGTYDDAIDRDNLQKEVDSLMSEINRIADSANFNGQKLLDGSLMTGGTAVQTITGTVAGASVTSAGVNLSTATFQAGDYVQVDGKTYTYDATATTADTDKFSSYADLQTKASTNGVTFATETTGGTTSAVTPTTMSGAGTTAAQSGAKAKYDIDLSSKTIAAGDTITVGGKTYEFVATADMGAYAGTNTKVAFTGTPATDWGALVAAISVDGYDVSSSATGKLTFEATAVGAVAGETAAATGTSTAFKYSFVDKDTAANSVADTGATVTTLGAAASDATINLANMDATTSITINGKAYTGNANKAALTTALAADGITLGGTDTAPIFTQTTGGTTVSTASTPGAPMTLQIGDTSDSYNQLQVSVQDMHAAALKIDGVDISTLEGAQAAINTIKTAINTVSSQRGDLGAIQNRLEHTQNNLSVMEENITDAESTIRDTDIADEMMSYTKNNILIQSAQAMLAQANAVPQGVLQLLQ